MTLSYPQRVLCPVATHREKAAMNGAQLFRLVERRKAMCAWAVSRWGLTAGGIAQRTIGITPSAAFGVLEMSSRRTLTGSASSVWTHILSALDTGQALSVSFLQLQCVFDGYGFPSKLARCAFRHIGRLLWRAIFYVNGPFLFMSHPQKNVPRAGKPFTARLVSSTSRRRAIHFGQAT
jgi:hypothetical protein